MSPASEDITRLLIAELPRLRARARVMVGDAHLADDILQEVAVVVLRSQDTYQPGSNFSAWVNEIHRRVALAECRRRGRRTVALDSEVIDEIQTIALNPEAKDRERAALDHCMELLPEDGREALRLRYSEELPSEVIAARLHRSVDGVKSLLKRLRLTLSDCIERRLNTELFQ
jgi:RNA polymerase sigma-70 factor (ECF subfamily)